jgi:hypothetical protein
MQQYTVIYTQPHYTLDSGLELWQFFLCMADDSEHAEEQCLDAYPDCAILWVNTGINYTME